MKDRNPIILSIWGIISLAVAGAGCIVMYFMAPMIIAGEEISLGPWSPSEGISFAMSADPAGMVFACTILVLWMLISLYSLGYTRGRTENYQGGYYPASIISMLAALGLCFASDLFTFFAFYAVLAIAGYPLAAHSAAPEGKTGRVRYIITAGAGCLTLLGSIIYIHRISGTTAFVPGGFLTEEMLPAKHALILLLVMAAAFVLSTGVVSLHGRGRDGSAVASPAAAVLDSVTAVNACAFGILRTVLYVFGPKLAGACRGAYLLAWIAAGGVVLSCLCALLRKDLRARISFNTICHLAYIVMGICVLAPFSTAGAIYHIAAHSFMKAPLVMAAGVIFARTGAHDIYSIRGAGRHRPLAMMIFAAAAVGLAGMPGFAGFVSESNILLGAAMKGRPFVIAALGAGMVLTLASLIPVVLSAFRRDETEEADDDNTEAEPLMLIPIMIACLISIILGVVPNAGFHLFDMSSMIGNSIFMPLM